MSAVIGNTLASFPSAPVFDSVPSKPSKLPDFGYKKQKNLQIKQHIAGEPCWLRPFPRKRRMGIRRLVKGFTIRFRGNATAMVALAGQLAETVPVGLGRDAPAAGEVAAEHHGREPAVGGHLLDPVVGPL
jgi:hypothetical protein